jgi:hypothetical protein
VFFLITVQGARLGDATVAANALLLNGLLLTAHALDGLAHAVEALCGHAIGARDRLALRRSLVVAGGWSLIASLGFAVLFLLAGHLFIEMQTDIQSVRDTAFIYLPYLAVLPLIAVWSYLLDGLFIGATRAREMRNGMLLTVLLLLPFAWFLQALGNHGLWISFLLFMVLPLARKPCGSSAAMAGSAARLTDQKSQSAAPHCRRRKSSRSGWVSPAGGTTSTARGLSRRSHSQPSSTARSLKPSARPCCTCTAIVW